MSKKTGILRFLLRSFSYVLVAAAASVVTLLLWGGQSNKLTQLEEIINNRFIGQVDMEAARDAAANAMVDALGDRWSYYIPAADMQAHQENKNNAYVGIGITISLREDGTGLDILEVTPGGSAQEAGLLPGDILVEVQGQAVPGMTTEQVRDLVRGEEGTKVSLAVLRNGERLSFSVERRQIRVVVATGRLLPGNIGLVRIANFNTNCAQETIAVVEDLQKQGATALILDVRNNPGGYVNEMVKLLDHLLPEGLVFQSVDYLDRERKEYSDKACVELPMTVLVNGSSYSAAEFFAAALAEYDWASVVGEKTVGKGYYQNTLMLDDGSAVNLSTGKYFTPQGVNLTEAGGLTPHLEVPVDQETAALIYAAALEPSEDPQIQAAVELLTQNGE